MPALAERAAPLLIGDITRELKRRFPGLRISDQSIRRLVTKLVEEGEMAEPTRINLVRLFERADLETLENGLRKYGYLES